MKLSVIVTAYKCEAYLQACLDSIAAMGGDVELIVVKDVSPVGRARNEGLRKATGDYVWFVDGDDVVAPWTLDAVRPGSDIVMFGYERFADGGVPSFSRTAAAARTYDLDRREDAKAALQLAIDGLIAWSAWYRRVAFADCRFGPYRNCEDTLWGLGCFFRARTLSVIDARPYGYRDREGSASKRRGIGRFSDVSCAMLGVMRAAGTSRHSGWYFWCTLKYALGMVYRTAFPRRCA